MKFFMVTNTLLPDTGGVFTAMVYPFNDATRPTMRDVALAEAIDTGGVCYKVNDNAPIVERNPSTTPVWDGLNMRQSKQLRDYALEQGWNALATEIQAAIDAAKAAG